jgi:2-haloalkanoic acid dehalogenase type II
MPSKLDVTPVRAVIFDYFFTLAKPDAPDVVALTRSFGVEVADEDAVRQRLDRRARVQAQPELPFDGPAPPFRTYRERWVSVGDEVFGGLARTAGEHYAASRWAAHAEAPLFGDTLVALAGLRRSGYRLGVLSDADEGYLRHNIDLHGLDFDAVVCSQALRCYKPHRSTFEAVCRELSVQPGDALFVGDSPVTDIDGARRAGLHAAWINRRDLAWPGDLPPPSVRVESLTELSAVLTWR